MNRRDKMKKIIIFILILMFAFSFVKVSFAETDAEVILSDNYVGHSTEYDILFYPADNIGIGSEISINFDDGIPIFRNKDKTNEICVNGVQISEDAKFFGHKIVIYSPVEIKKNNKVLMHIPKGIMQNPDTPGYFKLTITVGNSSYKTNYYHITDKSTVRDVQIEKLEDGIEITFETGFNGSLKGYKTEAVRAGRFTFVKPIPQDLIFIRFSHTLSENFSSISKNDITVNGYNPPMNPAVKTHFEDTEDEEKEISICVPRDINANSSVKVLIKGISISDEKTSGVLSAKLWTSKEFTPVESNRIEIKGAYFLETSLSISPKTPDGENGFYKTTPVVTLKAYTGTDIKNVKTYYSFDGQAFTEYSEPIKIEDGEKRLYYYSIGYAGKMKFTERIHTIDFLVDSTPPDISIESELTSNTSLYDLKIHFSDENFDYAVITIYGINFTVTDKSANLPLYLFNKSTPFAVKAFDRAGNITEFSSAISVQE
jgi:hypothetical protein